VDQNKKPEMLNFGSASEHCARAFLGKIFIQEWLNSAGRRLKPGEHWIQSGEHWIQSGKHWIQHGEHWIQPMEHSDVTQAPSWNLPMTASDLLTKANSTPFQTATSASSTVPSKDSVAKKVVSNHIYSGFATDGMAAKKTTTASGPRKGRRPTPNICRVGGSDGTWNRSATPGFDV
jgi:hypothetical protein